MNVLWITNIMFPEALMLLTGGGELKSSGGWMLSAAEMLIKQPGVHLSIATISDKVKSLQCLKGERIVYYLLPYGKGNIKYNKDYEPLWLLVKEEVHPDIVHIYGTEFTQGLAYTRACGTENVVVSIQGLIGMCSQFYHSGITKRQIYKSFTLRSIFHRDILSIKKSFEKRGALETELLQNAQHIIGRTTWDRSHTWAINPQAQYYHVGETLRDVFYDGMWDYAKCKRHSIFLSQGNYPLKGLHMVLKAMPFVLQEYPDATIRVAGKDITKIESFKDFIKLTDYGYLIRKLIKDLSLYDVVTFTGPLNAEEMKNEYLTSNVFVCPSSIENSPNSLGEAQVLGVPVVASYVGGVPDLMKGDEDHLYCFDDVVLLAKKICLIFKSCENQPQVIEMRDKAFLRHDPTKNCNDLMFVYKKIIQSVNPK